MECCESRAGGHHANGLGREHSAGGVAGVIFKGTIFGALVWGSPVQHAHDCTLCTAT